MVFGPPRTIAGIDCGFQKQKTLAEIGRSYNVSPQTIGRLAA